MMFEIVLDMEPKILFLSIFLENLLSTGDPYLTNLVYVSFLENLSPLEEDYKRLKSFFGPLLLNESKSFETFWDMGK